MQYDMIFNEFKNQLIPEKIFSKNVMIKITNNILLNDMFVSVNYLRITCNYFAVIKFLIILSAKLPIKS